MAEKFIDRLKKKGESVWRRIFAARAEADKNGVEFTTGYQKKMKAGTGIRIDNGDTIVNTSSPLNSYKFHYLYSPEGELIARVEPDNIGEGLTDVKDSSSNDEYQVSISSNKDTIAAEISGTDTGKVGAKITFKFSNSSSSPYTALDIRKVNADGSYGSNTRLPSVPANGSITYTYTIVKGRNVMNVY